MSDLFSSLIVPPVDPQQEPPVRGSQQTRRKGLEAASLDRVNLWGAMMHEYAKGPKTDWDMHLALDVERTTINARRNELVKMGKVRDTGETKKNQDSGVPNVLWGLVSYVPMEGH